MMVPSASANITTWCSLLEMSSAARSVPDPTVTGRTSEALAIYVEDQKPFVAWKSAVTSFPSAVTTKS